MKRSPLAGGLILLGAGACVFLFDASTASIPIAITLNVVGIALVAGSRRQHQQRRDIRGR